MAANQKVYVEITGTAQRLVNEVTKAQKSLGTLELAARRLQNTIMGIGAYQVLSGISNVVNTLAEFDKTMTQVRVITGATSDDFDKLQKSALNLGTSTQFTAKQVGELQLEFGRLGFSTKEILDATRATVDLATATGEGLARSAEIAGSTLRAFQLDSKQMSFVTDVMAASLNKSALTLDTFADAIKYVAPVAKASNVTLEETAAMMSILADAGIKGSQAGTSLRRIFTMLTKDGKPLQERLDELSKAGISLADANDEVGLYAQTALLVLGSQSEKVKQLTGEIRGSVGATNNMAMAMENNLDTAIKKVGTAWDGLILSFKNSKGVLMSVAASAAEFLNRISGSEAGDIAEFERGLKNIKKILVDGNAIDADTIKPFFELAEKLNKELYITYDTLGKIKSINLIERTSDPAPQQQSKDLLGVNTILQQIVKNTEEKNQKDKEQADLIKKQADEYQRLIEKTNEYYKIVNQWEMQAINRKEFEKGKTGTIGKVKTSLDQGLENPETLKQIIDLLREKQMAYGEINKEVETSLENTDKLIFNWDRLSQSVAFAASNIIAADEDISKSVQKLASDVLRSNAAQIASWLALKFVKDSASKTFIFAKVALAAGIAVVSGLLGKEWRKGAQQGGSNNQPSYGLSAFGGYASTVTVYQRGTDMVGTLTETNRLNGRTRG